MMRSLKPIYLTGAAFSSEDNPTLLDLTIGLNAECFEDLKQTLTFMVRLEVEVAVKILGN